MQNVAVELLQITRVAFCRGKNTLVWFSCGRSHFTILIRLYLYRVRKYFYFLVVYRQSFELQDC